MPGQVKAKIPPEFNQKAVLDTLQAEMEKFAPFLVKDFEKTTVNWEGEKPTFTPVLRVEPGMLRLQIRVTGPQKGRDKWKWINAGTRPHKILPKRAKRLKFQTGYQAGSTPGKTFTTRHQATGEVVFSKGVNHPGNAPRNWSEIIVKENQRPFERWMTAAMQRAAAASGHGVK